MPDAVAFPLIGLIAAGLVALALVWPQGEGAPSPAPFGHPMAAVGQPAPPQAETTSVLPFTPGAGRAAIQAPGGGSGAGR